MTAAHHSTTIELNGLAFRFAKVTDELTQTKAKLANLESDNASRQREGWGAHCAKIESNLATAVEALESASERLRDRKLDSDVMAILQEALRAVRGDRTSGPEGGSPSRVSAHSAPQRVPVDCGSILLTPNQPNPKPEPAMARAAVAPGAQPPRPMPPPPEPAKCTCGHPRHEPCIGCLFGKATGPLVCPCTWDGRTDGGEK